MLHLYVQPKGPLAAGASSSSSPNRSSTCQQRGTNRIGPFVDVALVCTTCAKEKEANRSSTKRGTHRIGPSVDVALEGATCANENEACSARRALDGGRLGLVIANQVVILSATRHLWISVFMDVYHCARRNTTIRQHTSSMRLPTDADER